jgi:nucleotide-binding universal stress UspA family protein
VPTSMSESLRGPFRDTIVPIDFRARRTDDPDSSGTLDLGGFEVSDATWEAVRLADRLTAGGKIHLVHVTPELTHFGLTGAEGTWFPHDSAASLERIAKAKSMMALAAVAERCTHVDVAYVVRPGHPSEVILDLVASVSADAIVLAVSGRGPLRRALLGSTADKVIRQAACPVLVVPPPPRPQF